MPDLSAMDPEWREHFTTEYGDNATQEWADSFAAIHPATPDPNVRFAVVIQADMAFHDAEIALNERRLERIAAVRVAYKGGATAGEIAEVMGIGAVRVYQMVAGARA